MWRAALTAAVLALAACAAPATAPASEPTAKTAADATVQLNADGSMDIHVSPDRVAECFEQGGCSVFTRDELVALMRWAAGQVQKQKGRPL